VKYVLLHRLNIPLFTLISRERLFRLLPVHGFPAFLAAHLRAIVDTRPFLHYLKESKTIHESYHSYCCHKLMLTGLCSDTNRAQQKTEEKRSCSLSAHFAKGFIVCSGVSFVDCDFALLGEESLPSNKNFMIDSDLSSRSACCGRTRPNASDDASWSRD